MSAAARIEAVALAAGDTLAEVAEAVYDRALDLVLTSPARVTSAAEGQIRLASAGSHEGLADSVQRLVVVAVPVARSLAGGARWSSLPWALAASTGVSTAVAVRTGIREVQVVASLVAYRIEQATGRPADRALVKRLAVELYLDPRRLPDTSSREVSARRLVRAWILDGMLGRRTGRRAGMALAAAEQADVLALATRWPFGPRVTAPVRPQVARAAP